MGTINTYKNAFHYRRYFNSRSIISDSEVSDFLTKVTKFVFDRRDGHTIDAHGNILNTEQRKHKRGRNFLMSNRPKGKTPGIKFNGGWTFKPY